jgi:23S rRNA (guanine745-N1)-methyltransferase
VLKPGGTFIMVFPDEMHLFGLKQAIYDTPYKNKPEATEIDGFTLISDEQLSYPITVEGDMIKNLFMMTPYAYRTRESDRERLYATPSVTTEVAFRILTYRKN